MTWVERAENEYNTWGIEIRGGRVVLPGVGTVADAHRFDGALDEAVSPNDIIKYALKPPSLTADTALGRG